MNATTRSVRVKAPGKINVSLRVGPLREDGYHSVASVYLAVSLYEEVTATATSGDGITVTVNHGQGQLNLPLEDIPLDGNNLAARAAALLAARTANPTGVALDITKRVPVAGGMGGGSADAAAALLACDALWNSGLSREELARLASGLGADVPFSLLGGTAVGLGVGDRLTPAISKTEINWVLVTSQCGLSTPQVYRTLDAQRERDGIFVDEPTEVDAAVLAAMRSGDAGQLADVLHNDLQPAALELAPELGDVLDAGERHGALAGLVSGSGPTIAFLTADLDSAISLQIALSAARIRVARVTGPVPGARPLGE